MLEFIQLYGTFSVIAVTVTLYALTHMNERRHRQQRCKSTRQVASRILGAEIRENFKHLQTNYALLESLDEGVDSEGFKYQLVRSASGLDHVWIRFSERSHQAPLRALSAASYDKLIATLIEVDEYLFEAVHRAYTEISDFNRARSSLSAALARDGAPIEVYFAKSTVDQVLHHRDVLETTLQEAHRLLTGSKMRYFAGEVTCG